LPHADRTPDIADSISLTQRQADRFAIVSLRFKQKLGRNNFGYSYFAFSIGLTRHGGDRLDDFYVQNTPARVSKVPSEWLEDDFTAPLSSHCVQFIKICKKSTFLKETMCVAASAFFSAMSTSLIHEVAVLKIQLHFEDEVNQPSGATGRQELEVLVKKSRDVFEKARESEGIWED
jgi:hypothetical protein